MTKPNLNPLDQFVKRSLRPGACARCVEDLLFFDTDETLLSEMKERIEDRLGGLRLLVPLAKRARTERWTG